MGEDGGARCVYRVLLLAVLHHEEGIGCIGNRIGHALECGGVERNGMDQPPIEVDELTIARDRSGARLLVTIEHPTKIGEDAPGGRCKTHVCLLKGVYRLEGAPCYDVALAPDERRVKVGENEPDHG